MPVISGYCSVYKIVFLNAHNLCSRKQQKIENRKIKNCIYWKKI